MLQYQFRPIEVWPGKPRTPTRSQFSATWTQTLDLLERELRFLSAKNIVIQAYVGIDQIRNDGMLYANARPTRPGVILSFDSKHGSLSYPCDSYHDWQHNVRAIALSLEALRSVDRHGVTRQAEQYKGWAKLPGPVAASPMSPSEAAIFILKTIGEANAVSDYYKLLTRSNLDDVYRRACSKTHPDVGGNAETFKRVQEAKTVLDKHFGMAS